MAKERTSEERAARNAKKDLKKKTKNIETNGITKSKPEKKSSKENKSRDRVSASATIEADVVDADGDVAIIGVGDEEIEVQKVKPAIVGALVPFANPLADDKTMKKMLKGVKRAAKHKTLKRGVKEVQKCLRKSTTTPSANKIPFAVIVIAGDISPMDVYSHMPVLAEDAGVPYIYVPSRAELGSAGNTKRPTSVVMIMRDIPKKGGEAKDAEEWAEVYNDLVKAVEKASRTVRV